jgi:Zn-dependent peptidase ImmA (M78 family)
MIDELAIRLRARQFMADLDLSNIHNDLSVYTRKVNAKLTTEEMSGGESGYTLTRRDGKSSIVVNELERRERQRFSACHEVGHLVLGLASNHQETPSWSYAKRDDNEIACDIFASELLMPFEAFKRDVDQEQPSFDLVERLRARYVVSFAACASRLAAVTDYPCAFVFMNSTVVRYASRSKALRDLNAWVEMRAPIPSGSVAHRLVQEGEWSGEDSRVAQDVWFRDWSKGYDLNELAKHYPNFDETFSLLWFEPDSGPDTPARSWGGSVAQEDDGGLKELDGVLAFEKRSKRK